MEKVLDGVTCPICMQDWERLGWSDVAQDAQGRRILGNQQKLAHLIVCQRVTA